MGILKTADNFYIWLLHLVLMNSINDKIEQMVDMHNHHPLSTESNKCSLQFHQQSVLNHQAINTLIKFDTFHCLNKCKGVDPIVCDVTPVVVEPPQDTNVSDVEMKHVNNILSVEELADEKKHTSTK